MRLGHIAYGVRDLRKTLDFYCGGLGFQELFTIDNDDGEPWLVYVKVSEREFLEFFPTKEDIPRGGSYQHLCLHVEDIHSELETLKSRGVTPDGPVSLGRDGNHQAWLTDPDGNRIELMQLNPEALQLNA